jgi:uncharacterized membrane protein
VITYDGLLKRATDKIRQAGRGMPAILICQLEGMQKVMTLVTTPDQRLALLHHARLVLESGEQSIPEEADRQDLRAAYATLLAITDEMWEGGITARPRRRISVAVAWSSR